MGRFGIAKVGFVLLGVWLAVTTLFETVSFLAWPIPLGWKAPLFHSLLVVLGVLIVLWADTLARRVTDASADPEGGSLRLVDLQSTCIALLGLLVLTWWLPRALVQLHRIPELWRAWGAEESDLVSLMSLYWQELVGALVASAVGFWFVLRSRSIAANWTRRLGDVTFRLPGGEKPGPQREGEIGHLQAVAFSVLGLYLIAEALPNLVVLGMIYDIRSPFEWTLEYRPAANGLSVFMTELVRTAVGVAFFLGARGLTNYWHRARSTVTSAASKPS